MASSLVGRRITANGELYWMGSLSFHFNMLSTIGAKYASVLPQPVSAAIKVLLPAKIKYLNSHCNSNSNCLANYSNFKPFKISGIDLA